MKNSFVKKLTALLLALTVAVVPFVTGFAAETAPADEEILLSDPRAAEDIPEIPEENPTESPEPIVPDEPSVEPEIPQNNNGYVACASICSSMSVPLIAGHTYIYVQNLSDKPIQVGLYEVPVGQGVSVGAFSFSVSDGWGLYYNLEAFRENRDNAEGKIWSKSKMLDESGLNRLSNNLKNYLNYWDPFFNCAFFAYSVWNVSAGDMLIPFVIPVLSHLMLMIAGGHKGALDLYCPTEDQVFRQRGSGSNARLEPVGSRTINA